MKKILYILGFLMISSLLVRPLVSFGAEQFSGKEEDVPFSTARIFSKLVKETGANPNADWKDTFGENDENDVGKNLYMIVYKKVLADPIKNANKNIAAKYGIPEGEMVRLTYGDISLLLDKKPGWTQQEAWAKISEIQQAMKEERELQQLQAEIKAAVEPSEIFANGDLGDSGFDLINDLTIIEQLLFLKTNPIDVGGNYVPAEESGAKQSPEVTQVGADVGGGAAGGGGMAGGGATTGTRTTAGADNTAIGATGGGTAGGGATTGTGTVSAAEEELNPNSCFATEEYQEALADFEEKKKTDSSLKDQSGRRDIADSAVGGATDAGGAGGGGTTSGGGANTTQRSDFLAQKVDTNPPVKPAPAANWLKDKACIGVFCIFVEMINKPATSAYQNADNCIACHSEKINDILKEVINHTLVPAKVPGNLGEPAVCKKALSTAFGSINMNIYAISNPIKTPVNDDIIFGPNIEDDWYNYCNAVAFPFGCRKEDPPKKESDVTYEIPASIIDTSAKKAITMAADTASQAEVARNINIAVQGYSLEKALEISKYEQANDADRSIGSFGPLVVELDNMNYYFQSIRDLLRSLHEAVDGVTGPQACTDLKNKKECS